MHCGMNWVIHARNNDQRMRPYRSLHYVEKPKRNSFPIGILLVLILIALVSADVGLRLLQGEAETGLEYLPEAYRIYYQKNHYGALHQEWESRDGKVKTNAYGMRSPEVASQKPENVTRIAIMGDSVSFGMRLDQEEIYPYLLHEILNQNEQANYEVLNFAAPGYTSFQGVKQYGKLTGRFQPDILVLAYGLYDADETRIADHELYSILEQCGLTTEPPTWQPWLERYSSLGHWFLQKKRKLAQEAYQALINERIQKDQWVRRVPPDDYYKHHVALIEHHQKTGGRVILVNANLLQFDYYTEIRQLAETFQLPLLDTRAIFDQLGGEEERELGFNLQLQPYGFDTKNGGDEGNYYRFRVYAPPYIQVEDTIYIVGNHPGLGDGVPNKVALNDNGRDGDEQAGDRIWSLGLTIEEKRPIQFAFTNSGLEGQWAHSQEDHWHHSKNRHFFYRVDPTPIEGPFEWSSLIYFFNKPPFDELVQTGHYEYTNAIGHEMIARRLSYLIQKVET